MSDDEMYQYPSDDEFEEEDDEYRDEADDEVDAEGEAPVTNQDGHEAQVLADKDILDKQASAIAEVVGILHIPEGHAAILLRSYKWNVSHATDEWFNNEEKVREHLGLMEPSGDGEGSSQAASGAVLCGICFEEFEKEETSAPSCGHSFCNECWTNYFNVSIADGQGCLSLRCPKPDCHVAVGDGMILKLASTSYREKFQKFLLRSYVDSSTGVKWCPAPGCPYAVALDSWRAGPAAIVLSAGQGGVGSVSANVGCRCGHSFCWNCLEEPHRPVECIMVKKWLVKNSAESENMNWILANSKACPKCQRPIEKNHGCMHMTCSAPCKHEFCWLCLGDWKSHSDATGGFYACNRYEDAKKRGDLTEEDQRKERARQSLERYLHYYERWATNETSRKKAVESLNEVRDRQADQLRSMLCLPAAELSFLEEAWQQVVVCRRVLKWTYSYGYYLEGDTEQDKRRRTFFEYLQGQAEGALGALHKCAEKDVEIFLPPKYHPSFEDNTPQRHPPSHEDFVAFKSTLTRLTAVTRNFFDNLAKALESGLAEVTEAPAPPLPATAGAGTSKGKGKDSKKKRRRFSSQGRADAGPGGDETSDLAIIDSGEEDLESGEEGDTNEAVESGGNRGGAGGERTEQAPEYWSCMHCTYANRTDAGEHCAMCRLPRQGN